MLNKDKKDTNIAECNFWKNKIVKDHTSCFFIKLYEKSVINC